MTGVPEWFQAALRAPSDEGFTTTPDGVDIHWLGWGAPGDPLVVLLHPGRGTAEWWRAIAPALSTGRRVLAVELSGHGYSGRRPVGAYNLDRYGEEIAAVVQAHSPNRSATLVGNSLGGYASIFCAANHRDLVAKFVLADVPVWPPAAIVERERLHQKRMRTRPLQLKTYASFEAARARFKLGPPQPDPAPYVLDHVVRSFIHHDSDGWRWHFDPNAFSVPWPRGVHEALQRTRAPYVVIRGALSALVDDAMARDMAAATGVEMPIEVLPDAYHHIGLDNPRGLVEILRRHLPKPEL